MHEGTSMQRQQHGSCANGVVRPNPEGCCVCYQLSLIQVISPETYPLPTRTPLPPACMHARAHARTHTHTHTHTHARTHARTRTHTRTHTTHMHGNVHSFIGKGRHTRTKKPGVAACTVEGCNAAHVCNDDAQHLALGRYLSRRAVAGQACTTRRPSGTHQLEPGLSGTRRAPPPVAVRAHKQLKEQVGPYMGRYTGAYGNLASAPWMTIT